MKLSLVIPAYNEESIAADTVRSCCAYLDERYDGDYELIVVSDGSTDRTAAILASLTADYPRLRPLGYDVNRGKGCAVRTGMLAAEGDAVVFTDCDLAYGTELVGAIADKLADSGADVVIGSRVLAKDGYAGYTPLRRFMSVVYLAFVRIAAGFPYSDSQCGIKAFTRDAARNIFADCVCDGFAFDLEALLIARKRGMTVAEQPAVIVNHRASKVRPVRDALRMLKALRQIKRRVASLPEQV